MSRNGSVRGSREWRYPSAGTAMSSEVFLNKLTVWFCGLGLLVAAGCGAEDPSELGGSCIGMGANCAASVTPCCSPLVCVAGRVCGTDTSTADSGTNPAADAGGTLACGARGESCVAARCCSGLVCVAGRVCGDSTTDGSVPDASTRPPLDGGIGSDAGGDAGGSALCANELAPCDVMPCCTGLECASGDFGMTCRDPASGGGGM